MESIDSESIDISSLKRRMLAPNHPSQQGLARSAIASSRVQSVPQARKDRCNDDTQQQFLMHESESLPPSTVPESLDIVQHDAPPTKTTRRSIQKMTTVDATQEISQDGLTTFMRERSRSGLGVDRDETQYTLKAGDDGYADLTSSYVPGDAYAAEELESEPVAYSPTQHTQKQVSQFPESQRFLKTPATVGQKRDYNGNTKESPLLPRKPVLRSGSRDTPSNMMGMTQLFSATQAATSPFVEDTDNIRSDRPSPAIELEKRPATATSSSPLRPIATPASEFRRATTEPLSHYKPVKYSQAMRKQKQQEELLNASDSSDSDVSFTAAPKLAGRRKRQQSSTSPYSSRPARPTRSERPQNGRPSLSSPIRPRRRSIEEPDQPRLVEGGRAISSSEENDEEPESEAETEQEDEEAIVQRSSQRADYDPEDKENIQDHSIQIPRTTVRPSRISDQIQADVQASPSTRVHPQQPPSSTGGIAVADSQLSQQPAVSQRQQPKSSLISGPDFVPQSQAVVDQQHGSSNHSRRMPDSSKPPVPSPPDSQDGNDDQEKDVEVEEDEPMILDGPADDGPQNRPAENVNEAPAEEELTSPPTTRHTFHPLRESQRPSTVAETDPFRQLHQETSEDSDFRISEPQTGFETAPAEIESAAAPVESSPPIITPGPKRKRMSDIANQETPSQQRWSQNFNPTDALGLDPDLAGWIDDGSPVRPRKRVKQAGKSLEIAETVDSTSVRHPRASSQASASSDTDELHQPQPAVRSRKTRQLLQKPAKANTSKLSLSRKETYDIEVTPSPAKPSQPIAPASLPSSPPKRATRATRAQSKTAVDQPSAAAESERTIPTQVHTPNTTPKKGHERTPEADPTALTDGTPSDTYRTAPTGEVMAPNVVFACYNGKTRAYYPARCIGMSDDQRYTIQWEGYEPDEVDVYGIRRLELHIGDRVKVDMEGVPKVSHVIRGLKNQLSGEELNRTLTDHQGYSTLLVAPKQRKSLPADVSTENDREVPVSAIYLDCNMWNQFKDRRFSYTSKPVEAAVDATGYATPAENSSTPTSPSSRHRRQNFTLNILVSPTTTAGIFSGFAFAISYDNDARRKELLQAMQENGATIISESFAELFERDSTSLRPPFAAAAFTALLADKHSRKLKYLQALALGLPCLSGKWVEACIEQGRLVDWQKYLLPAGECDQLEGAVRSRVLPPMDSATFKLQQQLDQRVHILEGLKVLVVTGKGKAEARMRNYLFFVHVMGAESVSTAPDLRSAKTLLEDENEGGPFDLLYVEKQDLETAHLALEIEPVANAKKARNKRASGKVVEQTWTVLGTESLVQSLILGEMVR